MQAIVGVHRDDSRPGVKQAECAPGNALRGECSRTEPAVQDVGGNAEPQVLADQVQAGIASAAAIELRAREWPQGCGDDRCRKANAGIQPSQNGPKQQQPG